ncbi:uncharacterized protein FOMMEDRAFT_154879 [Fomitiporia mediterranea MF3/22]|uniref:uncharacterized protein n=1 Tax=Fomitiporia mediterranea (strain MF3/22) TaxID=694068 RepID=UPI0004409064|nr:uncharacterized protein FOMMEDRAFT_154879 [Fomitiporia mediterranea MF3/22]EJD03769.1 hypothetical protein FOMMEDRAFT_154879 [Fomitiporia mediterranea MF3/22]
MSCALNACDARGPRLDRHEPSDQLSKLATVLAIMNPNTTEHHRDISKTETSTTSMDRMIMDDPLFFVLHWTVRVIGFGSHCTAARDASIRAKASSYAIPDVTEDCVCNWTTAVQRQTAAVQTALETEEVELLVIPGRLCPMTLRLLEYQVLLMSFSVSLYLTSSIHPFRWSYATSSVSTRLGILEDDKVKPILVSVSSHSEATNCYPRKRANVLTTSSHTTQNSSHFVATVVRVNTREAKELYPGLNSARDSARSALWNHTPGDFPASCCTFIFKSLKLHLPFYRRLVIRNRSFQIQGPSIPRSSMSTTTTMAALQHEVSRVLLIIVLDRSRRPARGYSEVTGGSEAITAIVTTPLPRGGPQNPIHILLDLSSRLSVFMFSTRRDIYVAPSSQ